VQTISQTQDCLNQTPIELSYRELEVLRLVVEGYSNPEIASTLYLSLSTVKTHVRSIMDKFMVRDRTRIAVIAVRNQLV
jgi:two-component system, NarL family, response regulator LiaR